MKIDSLMTREVRTAKPVDSLNTAAQVLWQADCGSLPVVDAEQRVVGILTDRDITMAAFFKGARLDQIAVGDVMAKDVAHLRTGTDVHDALEMMRTHQLRRLPVVDDNARLVGIVALADLARAWARRTNLDGREMRADDIALTLAGICRSHDEAPPQVLVVEFTPVREGAAATARQGRKRSAKKRDSNAEPRAKKPRKPARRGKR